MFDILLLDFDCFLIDIKLFKLILEIQGFIYFIYRGNEEILEVGYIVNSSLVVYIRVRAFLFEVKEYFFQYFVLS